MSLADIIRQGVATANAVTTSLQVTVKHEAWVEDDSYGAPVYASSIDRLAIVDMKQRLRRLATGQEVMQQAVVTFVQPIIANGATERREPIDSRDIITLPSGFTGPILDISGIEDPATNSPYMLEVILGTKLTI